MDCSDMYTDIDNTIDPDQAVAAKCSTTRNRKFCQMKPKFKNPEIQELNELSIEGEWQNCMKPQGHSGFLPWQKFLEDPKSNLCKAGINDDATTVEYIKTSGSLVVRLIVGFVSGKRPEKLYKSLYKHRETEYNFTGSGAVIYAEPSIEKCRCYKCGKSTEKKTTTWNVYISTATHVVFDHTEGICTTAELFYDSDVRSCVRKLYVNFVETRQIIGDSCILKCTTCDEKLYQDLTDLLTKQRTLYAGLPLCDRPTAVIISHPHGMHKHISWGLCQVDDTAQDEMFLMTSYKYKTTTCPGSSGAPVLILNDKCKERYSSFVTCNFLSHSGSNSEGNYSVEMKEPTLKVESNINVSSDDKLWQQFFHSLKVFWPKVVEITKQNLVLEQYHQTNYNLSPYFERIKKSNATEYLQGINEGVSDLKIVINKLQSSQEMEEALIFTSLILCYTSHFLKCVKAHEKEETYQMQPMVEISEIVTQACKIFLALMPWSYSTCVKELGNISEQLFISVHNMSTTNYEKQFKAIKFSESVVVYDVDILCTVLGLCEDFVISLKRIDPEIWVHQDESYHVMSCMEDAPDQHTDSVIRDLCNLGFTEETSSAIVNNITEEFIHHQSPKYWALQHLQDMFQCHPVLTQCHAYPYNKNIENQFFTETIRLKHQNNDPATIRMINVSKSDDTLTQKSIIDEIRSQTSEDDYTQLFHGTTHKNATSILSEGIKLQKGNGYQDFSHENGFYLSYVFSHAKKWATRNKQPAILVFKIKKSVLEQEPRLCFEESDNEWKQTVSYCRKGYEGEKPKDFDKSVYISGSMCKNPKNVRFENEIPVADDKTQLCIKKKKLSRSLVLQESIVCAIFYKEDIS